MAKKAVATLHEGSMDGRAYTKVIKMVKSPKTGAHVILWHAVLFVVCGIHGLRIWK